MPDDLTELRVQLGVLQTELKSLHDNVRHIEKDVGELRAQANRWKGAFLTILAVGSLIGWLSTQLTKLKGLFG